LRQPLPCTNSRCKIREALHNIVKQFNPIHLDTLIETGSNSWSKGKDAYEYNIIKKR
jgi:hypothetical protein